jgi:DHA1 family multidrug resistance protein-like MFS transporter
MDDAAVIMDSGMGSPWRVTLWAMVAVQIVMSISFSILSPIMPLFLPDLGVQSESAIDLWAGILASVTSFIGVFSAPVWGRLADTYGRKLMVLRSCFGIAVFTALMGASGSVWQLLALRAGMGVVAGYNASAIALVASQTPEHRLGTALGWLSSGNLLGTLIGPVIGGAIADITGSYRMPFYWGGAGCFVAFVLCWIIVPERFTRPTEARKPASFASLFSMLIRSGGLLPLFLVLMLAQFGTRAVEPVVTVFVQDMLGPVPHIATLGGIAFAITGLAGIVAVPFLGRRSDRVGHRLTLMVCLGGAALFTLPQALPLGYGAFVLERFGLGLFVGGILPAANALVGRLAVASHRGFVFGLTASATFMGNSLGPFTGGAVAATFGIQWVFVVTAALLLANLLWVWWTVPEPGSAATSVQGST